MVSMICAQPSNSVRFVNAIEGTTLTIFTNKLDSITLPYMSATAYFPIADGTIQITNVLDQNATSLNNGSPLLTSFGPFYTLVAIINEAETDPTKRFALVLFNETAPTSMDTSNDSTKVWVRLMDFSQSVQYITLAYQAGAIAQYVGFLQTTTYTPIAASTTQLRFYNSATQTYNTPSLLINTTFISLNAYTIMFFTSSNGTQSANVIKDRAVGTNGSTSTSGSATTTGSQSTSGSSTSGSSTSGSQSTQSMTTGVSTPSTSGTKMTTSAPSMTTNSPLQTGSNNQENGSDKLAAFGLISLIAIALNF